MEEVTGVVGVNIGISGVADGFGPIAGSCYQFLRFTAAGSDLQYMSTAVDSYWPDVVLALRMDGANTSTTFLDSANRPITTFGNARISTAQSKFGGSSIAFDGSGDYLTAPNSTDFNIQAGEFTVEAWVYRAVSGVRHYLLSKRNAVVTNGWEWRINADNTLQFFYTGGSSLLSSGTVPSGQWVHLATVRSGSTFVHYINGVASGSLVCANGIENTLDTLKIGTGSDIAEDMNGYIDELRITKGVARYSADFTPPTEAFLHDNEVLLLHGDGTNGSTRITDSSGSHNTVVAAGNAQINNTQSKFGGTSAKFDGTGDYLSSPSNDAFNFGTGDFTVEGFVYIEANSSTDGSGNRPAAIATYGTTSGGNTNYWWFYLKGDTTTTGTGIEFNSLVGGSSYGVSANVSVTQSAWHHVAVSRVSGSTKLFLDGTELTLSTNTLTTQVVSGLAEQPLTIGASLATSYTQPLNGYIDDLRITKGVGRYTSSFTPTAAAFPDTDISSLVVNPTSLFAAGAVLNEPIPITVAAVGIGHVQGDVVASPYFSVSSVSLLGPSGDVSAVCDFYAVADGLVQIQGTASAELTFTAQATGINAPTGRAASAMRFTGSGSGVRGVVGLANTPVQFRSSCVASHGRVGVASGMMRFACNAVGARGARGSAITAVPLSGIATGHADVYPIGNIQALMGVGAYAYGLGQPEEVDVCA